MANRPNLYATKTREEIEHKIKLGANVNLKEEYSGCVGTPFHHHCLVGNAEAVQTMVENGADLEMPVPYYESYGRKGEYVGWRPLELAMEPRYADSKDVRQQNVDACVKILLDAGASLERGRGEKPLIERAIERGNTQVVDKLVDVYGTDGVGAMHGQNGESILSVASWADNARLSGPSMTKHLLSKGIDPNCTDKFGQPALMDVASGRIPQLLEAGADANVVSPVSGETPLHRVCVRHGDTLSPNAVTSAKALLDYGAEVDALDNQGNPPLANVALQDLAPLADLLLKRGAEPRLALAAPMLQGVRQNPTIAKVQTAAVEQESQALRQAADEVEQAPPVQARPAVRNRPRL
ncbi:ankyrin repeat domain-containing protein [Paraburkholderia sp. C35]|uniref:ankyrin repeat domain-containing protein n=1 Tax=Paraburkholderia sp. C35 TaxID=2126993 RepID=UPI000D69775E|nr:ankyrin repeat domain-containing protein [Paraburkholderia sp. C35]